jgi:hypothetical protein
MSSSTQVAIITIPETTYGVTPTLGAAVTAQAGRFTSESLSGTPTTTESAEMRTDRMSGGQVVTGLEVGGSINFELSPEPWYAELFRMGMMQGAWTAATTAIAGATFTPDALDKQKGVIVATGVTGIKPGDVVQITPATGTPVAFVVTSVTAPNVTVVSQRDQAAVTGSFARPAFVDIGAATQSMTVGKSYKDVTHLATTEEHSQTYSGMVVSGFNVQMSNGAIVTGSFEMSGNGYKQEHPSLRQQLTTAGGTVTPAGTNKPLNASFDAPVIGFDNKPTNWCLTSWSLTLDNGLTPQNCIGHQAPRRYELGTAAITVDASLYLSDTSYDEFMARKLDQKASAITLVTRDANGGFAFALAAVQWTFPDPSASGANQPVMIEAKGVAKVGAAGESALRIYKFF